MKKADIDLNISKQDLTKVENCEYYLRSKQIIKNAEVYKNIQVGEVYFIKCKDYDGNEKYVTAGWSGDPSKFIVFHKDDGFIFIKRIIASGKPGQEVMCLTTQFNVDEYWLEADPDYVNSILLQDEDSYDPFAASKIDANKKNKARRKNKKLEIKFNNAKEAYNFIKTLKVGDTLYDALTTYGSATVTWEVTKIDVRAVSRRSTNMSPVDAIHYTNGFKQVIEVQMKVKDKALPRKRKYINTTEALTFREFTDVGYCTYYKVKPYTVDDV